MAGVCPVMSRPVVVSKYFNRSTEKTTFQTELHEVDCMGNKCKLWTCSWTTEGSTICDCAHVINAMKGKEGKVIV